MLYALFERLSSVNYVSQRRNMRIRYGSTLGTNAPHRPRTKESAIALHEISVKAVVVDKVRL